MTRQFAELPMVKAFEIALARELDRTKAREIVHKAAERHHDLYSERKRYDSRALRQHLEENILPGVALYQALLDDPDTQQRSMDLVQAAFEEWWMPRRRLMERLGRFSLYYWLIRAVIKPMMRRNFPPEGWEIEWVEASGDTLAFNMTRCFYLDVLEAHRVPELTALYCKTDDLVSDGVSPHVRWARKRTLGRGDDCCDFRWERVRGR